jgi:hypothetical protein
MAVFWQPPGEERKILPTESLFPEFLDEECSCERGLPWVTGVLALLAAVLLGVTSAIHGSACIEL